jgi:general secretion pathway protein B
MSFILDALKKLEQKRQRGSVPDLMTVHVPVQQEMKKRPFWHYLILGALILNAALLSVWLQPWKPSPPSPAVNKPAYPEPAANQRSQPQNTVTLKRPYVKPATEVQQKELSAPKAAEQRSAPEKPSPKPPAFTAEIPAKETRNTQLQKTTSDRSSNIQHSRESVSTNEPEAADVNKSVTGNSLPEVSQLPQSTQSEIPQLKIFGHIYSNSPGTRLININGDIYREGDTVSKNLKVEEITESGVILNYNGTRFLIRAF